MPLNDRARRRLALCVLGGSGVAALWAFAVANTTFGFFLPGLVTLGWLVWLPYAWSSSSTVRRESPAEAAQRRALDAHRRAQMAQQRAEAEQLREQEPRAAGMDTIDTMPGVEFEKYVAAIFRGLGYSVAMTKATGDFGVDLILTKDAERTAVQCKRQGNPVGGAAIQQVVAGAAMHNCTQTMVVCNRSFTRAAHELAKAHDCQLVNRGELGTLAMQAHNAGRPVATTTVPAPAPAAPITVLPATSGPTTASVWELRAALAFTAVVVAICVVVGINATTTQKQAQVAQEAAEATAPCPQPISEMAGLPEPLVSLPDFAGRSAQEAFDKLDDLGFKGTHFESTDPHNKMGMSFGGWVVVRTVPRAGCLAGPTDQVTVYTRYAR